MEDEFDSLFKRLLKGYYSSAHNVFPRRMENREFGFGDLQSKIRYRHFAFKTKEALRSYLVEEAPPFVSCSTAEYKYPDARPIETKGFLGADLVFDLDANDLKLDCTPSHMSSWVCGNCLDNVKDETIRLIEEFLVPDFGFSKDSISVNFSGNRGYHVHVNDSRSFLLGGEARREISTYISGFGIDPSAFFPTINMAGHRLEGPRPSDGGWGGKLARRVVEALNEGEEAVVRMGIEPALARRLIKNKAEVMFGIASGNWDKIRIPRKGEFWTKVFAGLAIKGGDNIDRNVTNDISHLLRLPNSIHGDTGLIAKEVELARLPSFDPRKDCVAFKQGELKVKTGNVQKFEIGGIPYGPYLEREVVVLPMAAAVYLVRKGFAVQALPQTQK
jgi:DNA primase small subunit